PTPSSYSVPYTTLFRSTRGNFRSTLGRNHIARIDPDTGEKRTVYVFIATLPCSQMFYAEGAYSMDLPPWGQLHQHTFEYIGGTPHIIVPDNLKTGVTKHTSKELI